MAAVLSFYSRVSDRTKLSLECQVRGATDCSEFANCWPIKERKMEESLRKCDFRHLLVQCVNDRLLV